MVTAVLTAFVLRRRVSLMALSVLRYKKASEGMQTELELGRREAEGLRCKLQAANDNWKEVVDGAGGAREAASLARYIPVYTYGKGNHCGATGCFFLSWW